MQELALALVVNYRTNIKADLQTFASKSPKSITPVQEPKPEPTERRGSQIVMSPFEPVSNQATTNVVRCASRCKAMNPFPSHVASCGLSRLISSCIYTLQKASS
jgi:hypothetical protein